MTHKRNGKARFAQEFASHNVSYVTQGNFIGISFVGSATPFELPIEVSLFYQI